MKIEQLMEEAGMVQAPEGFTGRVMQQVSVEPEKTAYKPLIGRGGRLLILFFISTIVVVSVIYSEPGARFLENGFNFPEYNLPEINLNLRFLSDMKLSTGVLSALAALFILVLSDAGISRKRVF